MRSCSLPRVLVEEGSVLVLANATLKGSLILKRNGVLALREVPTLLQEDALVRSEPFLST